MLYNLLIALIIRTSKIIIIVAIVIDAVAIVSVGHNTIQYNAIPFNLMQYTTVQYNTTQYHLTQYNTIQYKTIQLFKIFSNPKPPLQFLKMLNLKTPKTICETYQISKEQHLKIRCNYKEL